MFLDAACPLGPTPAENSEELAPDELDEHLGLGQRPQSLAMTVEWTDVDKTGCHKPATTGSDFHIPPV